MNAVTMTKDESIRLMQAEIERLRGEIVRLRPLQWSPMNSYAEIERLRADLAATSDSLKTAAQILNDEERENERLRALLREAEKMWPNPGPSRWYRRVREALGE